VGESELSMEEFRRMSQGFEASEGTVGGAKVPRFWMGIIPTDEEMERLTAQRGAQDTREMALHTLAVVTRDEHDCCCVCNGDWPCSLRACPVGSTLRGLMHRFEWA